MMRFFETCRFRSLRNDFAHGDMWCTQLHDRTRGMTLAALLCFILAVEAGPRFSGDTSAKGLKWF